MEKTLTISAPQLVWVRLAIFYLLLVAILGICLRTAFVVDLPESISYRNLTHTHSHLAMLGWVYNAIYILVVLFFGLKTHKYASLFWMTQLSIIGMLFSFTIQGYGLISIICTSLHIIFSYIFVFYVYKDLRHSKNDHHEYDVLFLKTALFFLLISTIGTWSLGILMKTGLKGSAVYYGAIQFYLHFQFNGWFIFALLALLFRYLKLKGIDTDPVQVKRLYTYLVIATILTFALAISWSNPKMIIFLLNSLGVIIQLIALGFFVKLIKAKSEKLKLVTKRWSFNLLRIAVICLIFKIIVQGLVAIPYLATISYTIKNFIIGFIHLLNLGFVSCFVLALFYQYTQPNKNLFALGIKVFLLGFISTEVLLFLQGSMFWFSWGFMPNYYHLILGFSVFLFVGIAMIFTSYLTRDKIH